MTSRISAAMATVLLGTLLCAGAIAADSAADEASNKLAYDIFKQLIEINTSDSVGNVTTAAEAMAKRFRDVGFPAEDVVVPGRPTRRKTWWCACTAAASTSRCC